MNRPAATFLRVFPTCRCRARDGEHGTLLGSRKARTCWAYAPSPPGETTGSAAQAPRAETPTTTEAGWQLPPVPGPRSEESSARKHNGLVDRQFWATISQRLEYSSALRAVADSPARPRCYLQALRSRTVPRFQSPLINPCMQFFSRTRLSELLQCCPRSTSCVPPDRPPAGCAAPTGSNTPS